MRASSLPTRTSDVRRRSEPVVEVCTVVSTPLGLVTPSSSMPYVRSRHRDHGSRATSERMMPCWFELGPNR